MPRAVLWVVLAAGALRAGVVQGIVLEMQSGYPLARSRVRLDRIDSTGRVNFAGQLTNRGGQFVFPSVPEGVYVLSASRDGFAAAGYGQRRPGGAALPFEVTRETNLFTELRLHRLGVLTGRVLDENSVGVRGVTVLAYPVRPPLRPAVTGLSDDRGVYRLFGLVPGRYYVRTATFQHDDGLRVLPTFGPESTPVRDARIHAARLDAETTDADIRPIAGNLFRIAGPIVCGLPPAPQPRPVIVTLSSDSVRRQANGFCGGSYEFDGVAPGYYEVSSQSGDTASGFFERQFERESPSPVEVRTNSQVTFQIEGQSGPVRVDATILLRRAGPMGADTVREVRPSQPESLAAGYWELHARLPATHYLASVGSRFSFDRRRSIRPEPDPDWFEAFIDQSSHAIVSLTVLPGAASIAGAVASAGKAVAGIPVFLWPEQSKTRRSLNGTRATVTTLGGDFRFTGLPPGDYRVVASFDFTEVDEDMIAAAAPGGFAKSVTLAPSQDARLELAPFDAP